ncbi:MAG: DUF2934 domain-containing protein [Spirochaetes bacterium]|nr:DUF2934 domain-containing protein [Spirochaetota bacterium]
MKKVYAILILFICGFSFAFGNSDVQIEEVDFLLFLPNSSNEFANSEQAHMQLNRIANHLMNRNLGIGQIFIHGYAAFAINEIDPVILSKERALFVKNQLQQRGVQANLFSEPVAIGIVDTWGDNTDEESRSPNRRVRIMIDGDYLTPAMIAETDSMRCYFHEEPASAFRFPWFLLLPLLLIPFIFFLLLKNKNNKPIASIAASKVFVDLEEEIRFRAYELYLQRHGQNGNAEWDWYTAVCEICPRYEADGYHTSIVNGRWQAAKTLTI